MERYNELFNGLRYTINSPSMESTNAGINRMQGQCCGLFDIDYLFMKRRQSYPSRTSGLETAPGERDAPIL